LLASAIAYFFLLGGYYMLRSLREAYALQVGRDNIDVLFYLTFLVMLPILPAYWWLVARVSRGRLFAGTLSAVAALFVMLGIALRATPDSKVLAGCFFVATTSLNLFMVTVFWSTMVDLWRSGAAKRLFGVIAAGGSAGAIAGPAFNAVFVQSVGTANVIFIACALLLVAVASGRLAQTWASSTDSAAARPDSIVGGRVIDDLKRLAASPYLLAIGGLIVAGQVLGAFMYQEQARYVAEHYTSIEARAGLFAQLDLAVNLLALLVQVFVVGRLVARGGVRWSLSSVPLILIASLVVLALFPLGAVLLATQVVRRAADYGLFKPTREMLFTVLNPESKFKSKSLLDTLLQRGGDSLGQGLYGFVATLGLAANSWICAGFSAVMLLVALWVGTQFSRNDPS
jgi:AAA family ATP:ADP antiporter